MSDQKESFWNFRFWDVAILLFILGFLVWVAIPNFIPNPHRQPQFRCINNIRQINAAAYQFALEHHLTQGAPINFPNDLTPYIKLNSAGKIPSCPSGGVYQLKKVGELPTCTLSTAMPPHKLE